MSQKLPSIPWLGASRVSRILNRRIKGITANLPSSYPGIFFSVRIEGKTLGPVADVMEPAVLATTIRLTLREAPKDVTCRADPCDLAEVTDMCNQRLAKALPIPSHPHITATATISLNLSNDNRKALNEVTAARRKQGALDIPILERAAAIRKHFTDPAFALSWWLSNTREATNNIPSTADLQTISERLAKYPEITDISIEYQLLDLLRAFISEFPEQHQKQALLTLVSSGFQRAGADELAKQAQSLVSEETPTNGARPI